MCEMMLCFRDDNFNAQTGKAVKVLCSVSLLERDARS